MYRRIMVMSKATVAVAVLLWPLGLSAFAQQVTIAAPFNGVNDNFQEGIGVGWNFGINTPPPFGFNNDGGPSAVVGLGPNGLPMQGIQFGFGGPAGGLAPAVGGNGQVNGGQLGWQVNGNGFSGGINIFAGQGNTRSLVSETPFVTSLNGYPAFFSATSQRPFVTGLIPVVNGYGAGFTGPTVIYPSLNIPWPGPQGYGPPPISPLQERIARFKAEQDAGIAAPRDAPGELVLKRPADQPTNEAADSTAPKLGTSGSSAERAAPSLEEIRRRKANGG